METNKDKIKEKEFVGLVKELKEWFHKRSIILDYPDMYSGHLALLIQDKIDKAKSQQREKTTAKVMKTAKVKDGDMPAFPSKMTQEDIICLVVQIGIAKALKKQREEIIKMIKKKLFNIKFELVPNTPRKIMIGDKRMKKEFDDILTNLTKEQ